MLRTSPASIGLVREWWEARLGWGVVAGVLGNLSAGQVDGVRDVMQGWGV